MEPSPPPSPTPSLGNVSTEAQYGDSSPATGRLWSDGCSSPADGDSPYEPESPTENFLLSESLSPNSTTSEEAAIERERPSPSMDQAGDIIHSIEQNLQERDYEEAVSTTSDLETQTSSRRKRLRLDRLGVWQRIAPMTEPTSRGPASESPEAFRGRPERRQEGCVDESGDEIGDEEQEVEDREDTDDV